MANEMEREVCWGFLEMILPPEIKKVNVRRFLLFLAPTFLFSFLLRMPLCEAVMLGVTAAIL